MLLHSFQRSLPLPGQGFILLAQIFSPNILCRGHTTLFLGFLMSLLIPHEPNAPACFLVIHNGHSENWGSFQEHP